jgi:hypothetical protein
MVLPLFDRFAVNWLDPQLGHVHALPLALLSFFRMAFAVALVCQVGQVAGWRHSWKVRSTGSLDML